MKLLRLLPCLLALSLLGAEPKKPDYDSQYVLGPDSQEKAGVPKGVVTEFELADSKTFPGYGRKWALYVPKQYDPTNEAALMVFQDGPGYANRTGAWRVPVVFDNLIARKDIPVTIAVGINPGTVPASTAPGASAMKALGTAIRMASGAGTTAASATASCSISTLSSSKGEIR